LLSLPISASLKPGSFAGPAVTHVPIRPFVSARASVCRRRPSSMNLTAPDAAIASLRALVTPWHWVPPVREAHLDDGRHHPHFERGRLRIA
jgi:hypothetical protein